MTDNQCARATSEVAANIGLTKEPRDYNNGRSVAVRYPEAVANRRGVEQHEVNSTQRLIPDWDLSFCLLFQGISLGAIVTS